MKRFRQIIGKTLLYLGAALWVLAIASWLVSWWTPHGTYMTGLRRYGIWCERGFIQARYATRTEVHADGPGRLKIVEIGYDNPGSGVTGEVPKLGWGRQGPVITFGGWRPIQTGEMLAGGEAPMPDGSTKEFGDHLWVWAVPYYVVVLALSLPVALLVLQIMRARKAHRRAKGLCVTCGYDLRATPERCPECGDVQNLTTRDALPVRESSASSSAM
jgi:predicted RNA-binding Zn-ribbon protein involved in translation (DUF1610 family)